MCIRDRKLERTIYFSIKGADANYLSSIDAIGIKSNKSGSTIKIRSLELVKGEPLIDETDKDSTFVIK